MECHKGREECFDCFLSPQYMYDQNKVARADLHHTIHGVHGFPLVVLPQLGQLQTFHSPKSTQKYLHSKYIARNNMNIFRSRS